MSGEGSQEADLSSQGLSWQNPPATVEDGLKALGNTISRGVSIFDQIQRDIKEDNFAKVADDLNQFYGMLTQEYKALSLANHSFKAKSAEVKGLCDELKVCYTNASSHSSLLAHSHPSLPLLTPPYPLPIAAISAGS